LEDTLRQYELSLRATVGQNDDLKHSAAAATLEAEAAYSRLTQVTADAAAAFALSRKEISERDRELRELRAQLEGLQDRYDADTLALRTSAVEERVQMEGDFRRLETDLKLQLQEARFQVERSSQVIDINKVLEDQVEELQTKLATEVTLNSQKMAAVERKFIAEKQATQRETDIALEAVQLTAKREALASLSSAQKRIMTQNEGMGSEIVHLSVQTRKLTKNLTDLGLQRTTLTREVKDLKSEETLWAERCARLNLQKKTLEVRVGELESASASASARHAEELAALNARFARESEGLRLESLGLRSLMAHKSKELASVKKLASLVLKQRTEVEHFFLDSLALVKLEVLRRKHAVEAAGASAAGGAGVGPSGRGAAAATLLRSIAASSSEARVHGGDAESILGLSGLAAHQKYPILAPASGVDLLDLTPEDKWRALKSLYQHISQGGVEPVSGEPSLPPLALPSPPPETRELQSLSRPIGVLSDAQLSP
jgi:hypothetical protein